MLASYICIMNSFNNQIATTLIKLKKLFLLMLLLTNSILFAQNLTLNELFGICNKPNWVEVNEYLMKKGWEYNNSTRGDDDHYSTITWSYNKSEYSDKAQAWLNLYTYEGLPNKIIFSFFNKTSYTSIKSNITSLGMKLIESSIEDNQLFVKYTGGNFIVALETAKKEGDESYSDNNEYTAYTVNIIKKSGVYDSDNGKKIEYYDNGEIKVEYFVQNGLINGTIKYYHENGNLKKVGSILNGVQEGKFIEYDEDGVKTAEYFKSHGEVNGVLTIYENGLKTQEITKVNGVSNGKYEAYFYNDSGKIYLKIKGNYLNEMKHGLWETILKSGKKEELYEFVNYQKNVKNGAFKKYLNSDTLETGNYSNGLLDGKYKREVKVNLYKPDSEEILFSLFHIESEGSYKDGIKENKWIYYANGIKFREGFYKHGQKTGVWTQYVVFGNNKGNILNEMEYKNDMIDGFYKCYYEMRSSYDSSSIDNPIKHTFWPIFETVPYKNDKREGEYVLKDSLGKLLKMGTYINGAKNGLWIETAVKDEKNLNGPYVLKGNYINGLKDGIWEVFSKENTLLNQITFLLGKLNGKTTIYNPNNIITQEKYFENNELKKIQVFDSLGFNVVRKYEILKESDHDMKVKRTLLDESGIIVQEYFLSKGGIGEFSYNYFENYFLENINGLLSFKFCYPDGEIKIYDKNKRLLTEGVLFKEVFNGVWKFYYYDINILTEQKFENNIPGKMKYYEINSGKLFSGKYIEYYENGTRKIEFKISDGLRNGKSKYFDVNGKLIKIEKYKDGIIKT
jgi:antitoxin component YwqK of YwqJK toxin-antitoxin module